MKKNAIWTPSETMIRRELALAGRGPDNYKKSLQKSQDTGEDFIDDDNIAATADPTRPLAPGEISATHLGLQGMTLENRGMKLNEAKKQKREILARERAAELENEAQKLGSLGSTFKELFSKPSAPAILSPAIIMPTFQPFSQEKTPHRERPKDVVKTHTKKRKHEDVAKVEVPPEPVERAVSPVKSTSKKRKAEHTAPAPIIIATKTVTTTVPLAAPAPSPKKSIRRSTPETSAPPITPVMAAPEKPKAVTTPKDRATATSSRPRRISLTLKGPAEPQAEPVVESPRTTTRPSTRRSSLGQNSTTSIRDRPRRKTTTPPPPTPPPIVTAASRRSRRPAPGPVIEAEEGGAAVSVGRRQHAPRKRVIGPSTNKGAESTKEEDKENATKAAELAAGEDIDPDEPRYCLCGDVSYGDMVACENEKVSLHDYHCSL